jgi:hypothetical protein
MIFPFSKSFGGFFKHLVRFSCIWRGNPLAINSFNNFTTPPEFNQLCVHPFKIEGHLSRRASGGTREQERALQNKANPSYMDEFQTKEKEKAKSRLKGSHTRTGLCPWLSRAWWHGDSVGEFLAVPPSYAPRSREDRSVEIPKFQNARLKLARCC